MPSVAPPYRLAAAHLAAAAFLSLVLASGCRTASTVVVTSVPAGTAGATGEASPAAAVPTARVAGWSVETREHVDLWLHGFALLQADSSLVPYFRLSYASEVGVARRLASTSSLLDANVAALRARVAGSPHLTSAQFLALYFSSWTDLRTGCDRFLRDDGNVYAARSREETRMYATLATYFPAPADREWLRLFLLSLDDERSRFHHEFWAREQSRRAATRARIAAEWASTYSRSIGRFLNGSGQRSGAIVLALPLAGEGRSVSVGQGDNFITVGFPAPDGNAEESFFALAHEAVGPVAAGVVRDHSSPTDERSGATARWTTLAPVRAGAMLVDRVAPGLADGYRRYYLGLARQPTAADLATQFARIFPLPDAILRSMDDRIQAVLDGI